MFWLLNILFRTEFQRYNYCRPFKRFHKNRKVPCKGVWNPVRDAPIWYSYSQPHSVPKTYYAIESGWWVFDVEVNCILQVINISWTLPVMCVPWTCFPLITSDAKFHWYIKFAIPLGGHHPFLVNWLTAKRAPYCAIFLSPAMRLSFSFWTDAEIKIQNLSKNVV